MLTIGLASLLLLAIGAPAIGFRLGFEIAQTAEEFSMWRKKRRESKKDP